MGRPEVIPRREKPFNSQLPQLLSYPCHPYYYPEKFCFPARTFAAKARQARQAKHCSLCPALLPNLVFRRGGLTAKDAKVPAEEGREKRRLPWRASAGTFASLAFSQGCPSLVAARPRCGSALRPGPRRQGQWRVAPRTHRGLAAGGRRFLREARRPQTEVGSRAGQEGLREAAHSRAAPAWARVEEALPLIAPPRRH